MVVSIVLWLRLLRLVTSIAWTWHFLLNTSRDLSRRLVVFVDSLPDFRVFLCRHQLPPTTTIPTTIMMSGSDSYDLRGKYTHFRILVIGPIRTCQSWQDDAPATQPRNLVSTTITRTWWVLIDINMYSASDFFNLPQVLSGTSFTIAICYCIDPTYQWGIHDINRLFAFKSDPGFIFYNSPEFETGGGVATNCHFAHIFAHILISSKYFRCYFIGIKLLISQTVSPLAWMTRLWLLTGPWKNRRTTTTRKPKK